MHSISLVIIGAVFGFVLCNDHFNTSQTAKNFSEELQNFAENAKKMLDDGSKRLSEDVVDMGTKVKDAMEDLLEKEFNLDFDAQDNTTEFEGIDASGCDRGLLKKMETKCDNVYDQVNEEAQVIEDERKKTEALCCALEDFERCSLRAYDDANCSKDKAAIRENLKAARLFLSVVGNITCTEFRVEGIDASGCDRCLLKKMETKCDNVYDQVDEEAQVIEDERKKTEAVCCALEDFERCRLRAYDDANCSKDKAAFRGMLKAARIFLSVAANITCTEFRGVNGCNRCILKIRKTKCKKVYDQEYDAAQLNEGEKTRLVYWADVKSGYCALQAYDDTNCVKDKSDVNGCNINLFLNMTSNCGRKYRHAKTTLFHLFEDKIEKDKLFCCALKDMEKCVLRAHDDANCPKGEEFLPFLKDVCDELINKVEAISAGTENFCRGQCLINITSASEYAIDANGCNISLFQNMKTICKKAYDEIYDTAKLIEDEHEKRKLVCCALDDFEKCNLRAYDDSNCAKGKKSVKKYVSQVRWMHSAVAHVSCTNFRSQCLFNTTASSEDDIDVSGCKIGHFENMSTQCFKAFIQNGISVDLIEDENEKRKVVCCGFENYEKCILRAYDDANCEKSKAFLLYLRAASNFTCTEFGSQCLINATSVSENVIDTNGCNRGLLKSMETKCNDAFDYMSGAFQLIEDKYEKAKAVCCALEDFEKCSLQAYANANCKKGKTSTKENLKESGLFLCVVANVTCTCKETSLSSHKESNEIKSQVQPFW